MPNDAVFVPHFHWDREWYEPFQVFRHRLVTAMDTVLASSEADPGFRFTVDGQMAAIEDYLQMRPENRDRVAALVAEGRLGIGPWLILLDEFLCSGETIVRNLQMGWAAAAELGGAMPIGYLPDMFGHVAQMPQILARAGLEHAALWRGVPGSVTGHAFRWRAPDGSEVRTEFLFDGYDNGLDVLLIPDRIGPALAEYAAMTAERWGGDPVLAMAGTDHNAPDPRLGEWLRRVGGLTVATLDEYVRTHARDQVTTVVTGELRSHVRGNILPGVLSVRLALKQGMAAAERTIDHAERLNAQWSDRDESPFLALAWHKIIESTAHDSVVGSGTDETSDQVEARLAEATQAARAVRDAALTAAAASVPSDAYLVANPLPVPRTALIEVDVPAAEGDDLVAIGADGTARPVQPTAYAPTVLSDERIDASQLERVLRRIHRRELFGRLIDRYELRPGELVFHVAEVPHQAEFDLMILRGEVAALAERHPGEWSVRTLAEARTTVLAQVAVPPSGLAAIRIAAKAANEANASGGSAEAMGAPGAGRDSAVTAGVVREKAQVNAATATDRGLSNGLVEVRIAENGTLDITGADGTILRGVGRLVDGGDRGDSYNYGPPARDLLVEEPAEVWVELLENGPLRARMRVTRVYEWPIAIDADDRDRRGGKTVTTPVEMMVEVRSGEPFVRLATSFLNRSADHRLRLHVPLPVAAAMSAASGQFAVTERGLTAEGGWGEYPIPTFPADEFVSAGMATVLLDHATEYELVDGGSELAITLLRAVGSISVNIHPYRDEPAASEIAAPGAQDLGSRIEHRFAIVPSATGWQGAHAVALAAEFRHDVLAVRGSGPAGESLPADRAGLAVTGDDLFVSSIRRVAGGTEVRLVAMSDAGATARLTGPFTEATTADLLGRPLSTVPAVGELQLELGRWEIRTVVVR